MSIKAFEIAISQYGVKEIAGRKDHPQIVSYFNAAGFDGKKLHDETAWCSAFANWVILTAGKPISGKLTARSWLKVGESTSQPKLGDVVVLWRESPESWKGHVGFYVRETRRYVYILGGNQNNQVNIKAYPKTRVLDFRRI